MGNMFYLLNLTVSGIKSIKKEITLDFYKKTVDKSFNPDKYRIKAIYGENGSGKSAIITAVKIFQDLVCNENYLSESGNQALLQEMINKETKAFEFSCEYLIEIEQTRRIYNYTIKLELNAHGSYEMTHEKLMRRNGNYSASQYQTVFEIKNGKLIEIALDSPEREVIVESTLNLLATKSMFCLYMLKKDASMGKSDAAAEFSINMLFSLVFFATVKVYFEEADQHEFYFLRKQINNIDRQAFGADVSKLWKGIDLFSNVNEKRVEKGEFSKYSERIQQLARFIKIFKPELVSIEIDKKEDGDWYVCELILNYGAYRINKEFESTGIKKLIRLFDCFLIAGNGGTVFVDEMDSNLNDVYLCKLIEYFMYYGKGQLCFTTHNLDPMMILKGNKKSIEFLSSDNSVVSWTSRGNATPENMYRNGMIEDSPFNVDATDFIGIFGE